MIIALSVIIVLLVFEYWRKTRQLKGKLSHRRDLMVSSAAYFIKKRRELEKKVETLQSDCDFLQNKVDTLEEKLDVVGNLVTHAFDEAEYSQAPMLPEALLDLDLCKDYCENSLYMAYGDEIGKVKHLDYSLDREKVHNHERFPVRDHNVEAELGMIAKKYPGCEWELYRDPVTDQFCVNISETAWIYCGPVIVGDMNIHHASRETRELIHQLHRGEKQCL